jgi:hypothetical protein
VSAALYRAAALIPGVTVVADVTDAIGRHGVAVAFTYQGTRMEWIFNRQTVRYLGARHINVADGATTSMAAVVQRAFVDHAGQLPGSPAVPVLSLAVAAGAMVFANLVAVFSGRVAARTPTALLLRAE